MVRTFPDADTDVIAGVPGALGQADEAGPELVQARVDGLAVGLGLEPQAETITTMAANVSRNTVIS